MDKMGYLSETLNLNLVMLGEAGMGKSTAFHAETNGISGSHLISARQLIQSNLDKYPEWKTKTIFIDGLNEMRPGGEILYWRWIRSLIA